jgi:hypothetical protein
VAKRTPKEGAIKELLLEGGIKFRQGAKSLVMRCPLCNKKDKLYIRISDGRFVCWHCQETEGFEGAPEFALAKLLTLSLTEIQQRLYGFEFKAVRHLDFHFKEDQEEDDEVIVERLETPPVAMVYPPDFYPLTSPQGRPGALYLESRGIGPGLWETYGLQYCAPLRRVIFPIREKGAVVGWQARMIDPDTRIDSRTGKTIHMAKILTTIATEGLRNRVVMFAERLEGSSHAIIAEGPVDALKCHLCGGNVATMGKGVSDGQLARILSVPTIKTIYLGLDPDASFESRELVKKLRGTHEVRMLFPSRGAKDLGDMSCEAVLEAFQEAPRVNDLKIIGRLRAD